MSVSFSDTRTGSDQGTEALHESRCLAENKKKQKKIEIIYGFRVLKIKGDDRKNVFQGTNK